MPKPISAAEGRALVPGLRVVLVTMDSHLASAAERAHRTLSRSVPGLSLSVRWVATAMTDIARASSASAAAVGLTATGPGANRSRPRYTMRGRSPRLL